MSNAYAHATSRSRKADASRRRAGAPDARTARTRACARPCLPTHAQCRRAFRRRLPESEKGACVVSRPWCWVCFDACACLKKTLFYFPHWLSLQWGKIKSAKNHRLSPATTRLHPRTQHGPLSAREAWCIVIRTNQMQHVRHGAPKEPVVACDALPSARHTRP